MKLHLFGASGVGVTTTGLALAEVLKVPYLDSDFYWAAGYDTGTARGRTLHAHEEWMKTLPCSTLELRGDMTLETRLEKILLHLP